MDDDRPRPRPQLPPIGLGTMHLHGQLCEETVEAALAEGYRHIDTARKYGNEAEVGRALARSSVDSSEVVVVTKLAPHELSAVAVPQAAEDSLHRLGLDVIPLLLIHWPNPQVPLSESLEAMVALRDRGLVAALGVANFPASMLRQATDLVDGLVTDQIEYHPYLSQHAVLERARIAGMTVTAYCPLARRELLDDPAVIELARAHGCSPARVVLRWLVQQPSVVAIPGTSNRSRLAQNLGAIDGPQLGEDEMTRLHALARGRRVVDPPHAPDWD